MPHIAANQGVHSLCGISATACQPHGSERHPSQAALMAAAVDLEKAHDFLLGISAQRGSTFLKGPKSAESAA